MPKGIYIRTEYHCQRIKEGAKNNPNFGMRGKHLSIESRKKQSVAKIGHIVSIETRKKMRLARIGTHPSKETILKLRERIYSKESREKLRLAALEFSKRPEWKEKQRLSHLGHRHSLETRMKIGLGHKGLFVGTKNPMYGKTGDKNPNWNNGASFEPYSIEYNKEKRKEILERDNYTCQLFNCGNCKGKIGCHHIDYNKKNSKNNNLIVLCGRHNSLVNYNRNNWTTYFQEKLKNKFNYDKKL